MTPKRTVAVFAAFTLLVWGTRINNILADDTLSGGGRTGRVVIAIPFVVLGIGAFAWVRGRTGPAVVGALAVWTAVVWVLRDLSILVDGTHSVGFKVVHTVLALVSITLAWRSWTAVGLPRPQPLLDSV